MSSLDNPRQDKPTLTKQGSSSGGLLRQRLKNKLKVDTKQIVDTRELESPMASGLKRLSSDSKTGDSLPQRFDELMSVSSTADNSVEGDLLRLKSMVYQMLEEAKTETSTESSFDFKRNDIKSLLSSASGIEFLRVVLKYKDERVLRWGLRLSWLVIQQYQDGMFEPYIWHFLEFFTTTEAFDYFLRLALKHVPAKSVQKVVLETLFGEIKRPTPEETDIVKKRGHRRIQSTANAIFDIGKSKVHNPEIFKSVVTLICASTLEEAIDICRQMSMMMIDPHNCNSLLSQDTWASYIIDILKAQSPLFLETSSVTTREDFGRLCIVGKCGDEEFSRNHLKVINLCVSIFTSCIVQEIMEEREFTADNRMAHVFSQLQHSKVWGDGAVAFIRLLMHSVVSNISTKQTVFKRDLEQVAWKNIFTFERTLLDFILFRNQVSKTMLRFNVNNGECLDTLIISTFYNFVSSFEEFEFSSTVNLNVPSKIMADLWKSIKRSQELFQVLNELCSKIHVRRPELQRDAANAILEQFLRDVKWGLRISFFSELTKDDLLHSIMVAQRLAALQKKDPPRLVSFNVINVISSSVLSPKRKKRKKATLMDFEYFTPQDLMDSPVSPTKFNRRHQRSFSMTTLSIPTNEVNTSKKLIFREEMFGPEVEVIDLMQVTALYLPEVASEHALTETPGVDADSSRPKMAKAHSARTIQMDSLEDVFEKHPCVLRYRGKQFKTIEFLSKETRTEFVTLCQKMHERIDVITPLAISRMARAFSDTDKAIQCSQCESSFTMLKRQISCKICRKSFCGTCCSVKTALPEISLAKSTQSIHRVCEKCFEERGKLFQNSPHELDASFSEVKSEKGKTRFDSISETAAKRFSAISGTLSRSFNRNDSKQLQSALSAVSESNPPLPSLHRKHKRVNSTVLSTP